MGRVGSLNEASQCSGVQQGFREQTKLDDEMEAGGVKDAGLQLEGWQAGREREE